MSFAALPALISLAPLFGGDAPALCALPESRAVFAEASALGPPAIRASASNLFLWRENTRTNKQPIELWRADDGLFYVVGDVNGHPVRFLVDTGASMIVLSAADAARVGAEPDPNAAPVEAETAGGKSAMARVQLASLGVGGSARRPSAAVVAKAGLTVSLLGQNWLSEMGSMVVSGDRMTLNP